MEINEGETVLLIGKKRSGKTVAIKYLIYQMLCEEKFDNIVVFCNTSFGGAYDYVEEDYVHTNWSEEAFLKILAFQKKRIEEDESNRLLIILDDVLGDVKFGSDLFKNYISQSRHYNTQIIISSQLTTGLDGFTRENCEKILVFRQFTKLAMETCYESFGCTFFEKKEFFKYITDNTPKYQFVYIDLTKDTKEECFKPFKCPYPLPEFFIEQ